MKTVLIVVCDNMLADLLTETLEVAGYQPVCVSSREQGLSYIRQHKPDMVLVDSGVQGGGVAVVRGLRAEPALGALPVVLLSGAPLRDAAKELGAAFLDLPFTLRALVGAVADHIGAATA